MTGKRHLIVENGEVIGMHPADVTPELWAKLPHHKRALTSVIREKCMDCSHTFAEVRKCVAAHCPLWPYRMGTNPFRKEISEEQRKVMSDRFKAVRQKMQSAMDENGRRIENTETAE